jgi:hypothetical protein
MTGRLFINGALALAGLTVMLLIAVPPALAVDQPVDKMIGPSTEIKKETIDKSSVGVREDVITPGLTKELERPMSVPDPRAGMVMPDRKPLCGPWKNAINHYTCAPGYDSY